MGRLRREPSHTLAIASRANRLSVLAGLIAGVAYSTFVSFVANALTPVSGRLIELDSFSRTVSGRYQEVFSLNGIIPIVLGSLFVFALVWWMMRVTLERRQFADRADRFMSKSALSAALLSNPPELALSVSAVSK
jgi:hypothetical protein